MQVFGVGQDGGDDDMTSWHGLGKLQDMLKVGNYEGNGNVAPHIISSQVDHNHLGFAIVT